MMMTAAERYLSSVASSSSHSIVCRKKLRRPPKGASHRLPCPSWTPQCRRQAPVHLLSIHHVSELPIGLLLPGRSKPFLCCSFALLPLSSTGRRAPPWRTNHGEPLPAPTPKMGSLHCQLASRTTVDWQTPPLAAPWSSSSPVL
jgi:hypothetical protein